MRRVCCSVSGRGDDERSELESDQRSDDMARAEMSRRLRPAAPVTTDCVDWERLWERPRPKPAWRALACVYTRAAATYHGGRLGRAVLEALCFGLLARGLDRFELITRLALAVLDGRGAAAAGGRRQDGAVGRVGRAGIFCVARSGAAAGRGGRVIFVFVIGVVLMSAVERRVLCVAGAASGAGGRVQAVVVVEALRLDQLLVRGVVVAGQDDRLGLGLVVVVGGMMGVGCGQVTITGHYAYMGQDTRDPAS